MKRIIHPGRLGSSPVPRIRRNTSGMSRWRTANRWYAGIAICAIFLITITSATAHVPKQSGSSEGLSDAIVVEDASKSWAFYGELSKGEIAIFRLDVENGDRIFASLYTPLDGSQELNMYLFGDDLPEDPLALPGSLETFDHEGLSWQAMGSRAGGADYEPFGPSSLRTIGEIDRKAPSNGPYFIVVKAEQDASFGVAIGYIESFTMTEWLLTPFGVLSIHVWSGQNLLVIMVPLIATVATTLLWTKRTRSPLSPRAWIQTIIVGLMAGTGMLMLAQMIYHAARTSPGAMLIISIILVSVSFLMGYGALRLRNAELDGVSISKSHRLKWLIIGLGGLLAWTGLIIAPLLAIGSAVLPLSFLNKASTGPSTRIEGGD